VSSIKYKITKLYEQAKWQLRKATGRVSPLELEIRAIKDEYEARMQNLRSLFMFSIISPPGTDLQARNGARDNYFDSAAGQMMRLYRDRDQAIAEAIEYHAQLEQRNGSQ
jgi:cytolysin (calcineurin-like family phosphatase)